MQRKHMAVVSSVSAFCGLVFLSGCGSKENTVAPEDLKQKQAESLNKESGGAPASKSSSTASEVGGNPSAK
jgi:hypothetical protein